MKQLGLEPPAAALRQHAQEWKVYWDSWRRPEERVCGTARRCHALEVQWKKSENNPRPLVINVNICYFVRLSILSYLFHSGTTAFVLSPERRCRWRGEGTGWGEGAIHLPLADTGVYLYFFMRSSATPRRAPRPLHHQLGNTSFQNSFRAECCRLSFHDYFYEF